MAMGLPPTVFMKDLDKPRVYYKNELGFLNAIIKPLWSCLKEWLKDTINYEMSNIENNIEIFAEQAKEYEDQD